MTEPIREAFEKWAVGILGDNPNWCESGDCELAWQSWRASRETEQAQSVEPVATVQCVRGVTIGYLDVMQPVGTKLYLHPAPPLAGERAELIARLRDYDEYDNNKQAMSDAADMLEADAQAVPDKREPLTFDQIDALENRVYMQTTHKGRPMFEYVNAIIRAVEKHHGIGAKP
jgi:hypothetical protein